MRRPIMFRAKPDIPYGVAFLMVEPERITPALSRFRVEPHAREPAARFLDAGLSCALPLIRHYCDRIAGRSERRLIGHVIHLILRRSIVREPYLRLSWRVSAFTHPPKVRTKRLPH